MNKCWCGNKDFESYSEAYFWCKKCNSLVTKSDANITIEKLDDDSDFYGKNYWEKLMVERAQISDCDAMIDLYLKERAPYWLKNIYRFLLPGKAKVLEIGCGLGQLTYLLKCSGYRESAYELSPSICKYIKKELNINVINAPFSCTKKKYNAVIAMDVVEHLENPEQFFEDLSGSVKDDGLVFIQTPCFNEEMTYKELVEKNPKFLWLLSPNEHLFLFSRNAITRLLSEHGFKHVQFLDAFFGNDYDMFLVASKSPIKENSDEEIKKHLYANPNGRLINALISSSEESRKALLEKKEVETNRDEILVQLKGLIENYKELEANRDGLLAQLKQVGKE